MAETRTSHTVKRIFITLVLIIGGILFASLFFRSETARHTDPNDQEKVLHSVESSDAAGSATDSLLLKKEAESFQMPEPGPDEYVAVYDDEPDETVKTGVISSIQIVPNTDGESIQADPVPTVIANVIGESSSSKSAAEAVTEDADSEVPLFEDGDLDRLAELGADVERSSPMIGGASVSQKETTADIPTSEPTPTVSPSPAPEAWYEGQVRGYAALYLMHPAARTAVERQMQILMESRLRRVYLGVLVDGTFGLDYPYLQSILRRLNEHGQEVTLGLFLSNGPAMRTSDERRLYAGTINEHEPEEFRKRIASDPKVRAQFAAIARATRPTFEYNRRLSRGNENIAYVMLEDNLDHESYLEMRHIAGEILGDLVFFIRNPCPGCYEGNDFDPGADGLEFHSPELIHALRSTDGYSMDGKGLFFPGEFDPTGFSVGDVRTLLKATLSQGVHYFALWRAQRQGIYGERVPPDNRNYEIPTELHAEQEIDLLRFGLQEVIDDSDVVPADPRELSR